MVRAGLEAACCANAVAAANETRNSTKSVFADFNVLIICIGHSWGFLRGFDGLVTANKTGTSIVSLRVPLCLRGENAFDVTFRHLLRRREVFFKVILNAVEQIRSCGLTGNTMRFARIQHQLKSSPRIDE